MTAKSNVPPKPKTQAKAGTPAKGSTAAKGTTQPKGTTPEKSGVPAKAPAPAKPAAPRVPAATEETYQGLRRFNLIMGFLHLVQAIIMLVLSFSLGELKTYTVTATVLTFDQVAGALAPSLQSAFELPFGPAVAAFLLISAIAHFSLATFGYKSYVANLKLGMNAVRFYEYALSSSIMIVLIALLTGVSDLGALIALFGVNAAMNFFGIMMERHNQTTRKTDWSAFIYGCIAGIVPWIVIVLYFILSAAWSDAKPPTFVYTIIISLFIFFNIFAVNMYLQYKKVGRWKDYLFGERMYIVLSLVAKTLLAWQVFAGVLAP
jgi:hypothetical protein